MTEAANPSQMFCDSSRSSVCAWSSSVLVARSRWCWFRWPEIEESQIQHCEKYLIGCRLLTKNLSDYKVNHKSFGLDICNNAYTILKYYRSEIYIIAF